MTNLAAATSCKPFDLTAPIRLRDGRNARVVSTRGWMQSQPVIVLYETPNEGEREGYYDITGKPHSILGSPWQLVNRPEVRLGGTYKLASGGTARIVSADSLGNYGDGQLSWWLADGTSVGGSSASNMIEAIPEPTRQANFEVGKVYANGFGEKYLVTRDTGQDLRAFFLIDGTRKADFSTTFSYVGIMLGSSSRRCDLLPGAVPASTHDLVVWCIGCQSPVMISGHRHS